MRGRSWPRRKRRCSTQQSPTKPPPPPDPAKAALEAETQRKAKADADLAATNAEVAALKAKSEVDLAATNAEVAAFKAKFPAPADSGITGTAVAAPGSGALEAGLMTARHLDGHAREIAALIAREAKAPSYLVIAGLKQPELGDWQHFQVRTKLVSNSFARATQLFDAVNQAAAVPAAQERALGTIAAASTAIDVASKVVGYFRTNYSFAPLAVAGIDDELLATALAGYLEHAKLPLRWPPVAGVDAVLALLEPISRERDNAAIEAARIAELQRELATRDAATTDTAKLAAEQAKAQLAAALEANAAAVKAYEALLEALAARDAAGASMIGKVIAQKAIGEALATGAFAVNVQVGGVAATNYTGQKWLPGMPLSISGGAIVSFTVIKSDGTVLLARQQPIYTGFKKLDDAEDRIRDGPPRSR